MNENEELPTVPMALLEAQEHRFKRTVLCIVACWGASLLALLAVFIRIMEVLKCI